MRLLLAEDDEILADALVAQFGGAGFEVVHAPNGPVAEYLLTRQDFDVAILDIGLPMVDGLAVLKRLRAEKPTLPVLVLTALCALEDRVQGLNAGADDYLTKPFDFPELEARVRALLRRVHGSAARGDAGASAGAARAPDVGRLVFDRGAHRASIDGTSLELSPREWELLELLLDQLNRVVHKEQITRAWTPEHGEPPSAPGMIEVYIHRLRRKLEGSGVVIRTVRGLGYLLEPEARAKQPG